MQAYAEIRKLQYNISYYKIKLPCGTKKLLGVKQKKYWTEQSSDGIYKTMCKQDLAFCINTQDKTSDRNKFTFVMSSKVLLLPARGIKEGNKIKSNSYVIQNLCRVNSVSNK